ncbi:Alpha/beta hydrolase fold-1 [Niveomyces insectorum RCEF 264]|uniref:Alpha/beta hydrolase fold-1 n=1 Tax=Niveomyces insectorum RCEF 264 TaxID=1081102 RepID=A0A167XU81_9HYPO|nr:Alpha/beta hydrolase fold-1 [Niveomyces insectorum RCEF 264]
MGKSGILYVTIDHAPTLSRVAFEDWYNNEHGPLRLQLPFITSGRRYRAPDGVSPAWMAVYDVTDLDKMASPAYEDLRTNPSDRERNVLQQVRDNGRYFYEEEISVGSVNDTDRAPTYVATLRMHLPAKASDAEKQAMAEDINRWYLDEHIPVLQRIPGWVRSRRFKLSPSFHPGEEPHWFAIHEYTGAHGNGGPEFAYATSTVWRQRIMTDTTQERRNYSLHYDFGPYARDLAALDELPPKAVIEHAFTFADSTKSTYRLEGNTDPNAPVFVFVNSLITSRAIWDEFVARWGLLHPEYRFLRYESRGRGPLATKDKITAEVLAADLAHLLDGLKLKKVDAVIGVSLGGVTALQFALLYPDRLSRLLVCDCGLKSPATAAAAWAGRIKIAQGGGMQALAPPTIKRWFLPENVDGPGGKKVAAMVASNDLDGFSRSSEALYQYDLLDGVSTLQCKTMFVSGAADTMLPLALQAAAEKLEKGKGHGGFATVQQAGHLPMVENCPEFIKVVNNFLA